ncbi:SLAP domain-containing protein [Companilactobacillus farciminis]|uniref:SLAP domain-containing protein n=1 Tax=Companilactobacillus farciminis TaxID=1612 RepID=UPI00233119E2|nr:SLAP domain-containing protein [Companilactobacillus farciminis]WCG35318.1 SLAP domain-containing protein [Companilactobacillus farciminis]
MRKIKMIALTGILLSSTILGANTTVAQASSNKALSVDKSEIANNVIQVINELLNSSSTASNVNSQTKFSDLEDGQTMQVAPIFGQKTDTQFDNVLQGELNVVDGNEQLVPMTTVTKGDNGFVTEVKYTLDGATKTVKVDYNFAKPIVSFTNNSQVMNFKADDGNDAIQKAATDNSDVKAISSNGADANGKTNSTSVSGTMDDGNKSVTFTPKDNYISGISATRTVNTYTEPNWDSITTTDTSVVVSDSKNPNDYYLVSFTTDNTGKTTATATAIDAVGNDVISNATNKSITFVKDNFTIPTDPENPATPSSILTFKILRSGKTVFTTPVTGDMTVAQIQDALPEGYTLAAISTDYEVKNGNQTYYVTKSADTNVNYIDVTTGNSVGSETLNGIQGEPTVLTKIPENYKLVNQSDILQKLNALTPNKNIYVTPKADSNSLNYTVTFRDKTTGKVVGTESQGTGNFGSYVGVTAPDGYALASVIDHGFILLKNDQKVTKYVVAADTPYNVSYVDQDTGEEVGTQSGKGANESKIVLKAPTGYAFVNADDINYTIDKDTPTSTVYVQKSDQTVDNIVSGYPRNGNIKIYDGNGKLNNDVVLSEGSSWIIDKTITINGAEYYRVATDQYVKASDVYKYTPLQTVAVTNGTNVTPVYNTKGQLIIDRALDVNTPWYTDRSATIRGKKMYRVATDEWIKASDATLN